MKQDFGKRDAPDTVAESWELASHPDGESQVESGEWIGWTIKKLGELDHDGFWGTSCEVGRFPLIVKLIDAQRDLSIRCIPRTKVLFQKKESRARQKCGTSWTVNLKRSCT